MLITQMFRRSVQINGDSIAVTFNDSAFTWPELFERITRIAGGLQDLGLERGDRVAILARNTPVFYESYIALPWAGLVMTCLNNRWSVDELADAVDDSGARALVVDEHFAAMAQTLVKRCPALKFVVGACQQPVDECWETLAATGRPSKDAAADISDLAYIFYTGGTTGRSKGVMLSHLNFWCASVVRMHLGEILDSSSIVLELPLFHIGGSAFVGSHLAAGSHLRLLPSFDPVSVMGAIEKHAGTHVAWVPTMLSAVLNHPEFTHFDLGTLTRVFYGAAPISPTLLTQAFNQLPKANFVQLYGMTESGGGGTWLGPADHRLGYGDRLRSVGRAWPGMEIKTVTPQGSHCATNEIGEICMRGPTNMSGYWGSVQKSAEALKAGWLHTGDVGRIDEDGYVHLVDRLKDMIITGGENVYSIEVENALQSHPAVLECAVVGVPDPHWGEIVCAVVYVALGSEVDEAVLQQHCRGLIGHFKVPKRVLIHNEPLAKSAIGKILKAPLREVLAVPGSH